MVARWLQRRMEAQIEYLMAENALYENRLVGRVVLRLAAAHGCQLPITAKVVQRGQNGGQPCRA